MEINSVQKNDNIVQLWFRTYSVRGQQGHVLYLDPAFSMAYSMAALLYGCPENCATKLTTFDGKATFTHLKVK